jgi:hypothetical protein
MYFDKNNAGFHGNQDKAGKHRKNKPDHRQKAALSAGGRQNNGSSDHPAASTSDGVPDYSAASLPRQYSLAEEDSKRIFISIGRNRRVFPREILGLIIAKTGVSRDNIGAIRILDNYSFVQVRDTVADQIIEALDNHVFRGRTLTVNYAKTRKDEAGNQETSEQGDVFDDNNDYSESDESYQEDSVSEHDQD